MSSFTEDLTVKALPSGQQWQVEREFTYYIGHRNSSDSVTIQQGFVTDFASIPRIFWSILPPFGKYTQAAVLHDYMCWKRKHSSRETHRVFLESMEVLGVPTWKRKIMYYAVKIFGPRWD